MAPTHGLPHTDASLHRACAAAVRRGPGGRGGDVVGPCPPPCVEGREGEGNERGEAGRDLECDCEGEELGFYFLLYYGGAITTVRSGMDGQRQLGCLG